MMIGSRLGYAKILALLALFGFVAPWAQAQAQLPVVNVRLSNPAFRYADRTLTFDLELQAAEPNQQLFGMNVRFFYDAEKLQFKFIDELADGYGILGEPPAARVGNAVSGASLFNMDRAAAFVNGAVQLMAPSTPVTMAPGQWTKYFRLNFVVPAHLALSQELFYPSVVLDSKGSRQGGFLPGENGIVITLREQDPSTAVESAPTEVAVSHLNWLDQQQTEYPYGTPIEELGIDLNPAVVSDVSDAAGLGKGIRLLQNYPNPFIASTQIEFILPAADQVALRFFDVSGRELGAISGYYPAGRHQVEVNKTILSEVAEVILYRLETADYRSGYRKMTWLGQ